MAVGGRRRATPPPGPWPPPLSVSLLPRTCEHGVHQASCPEQWRVQVLALRDVPQDWYVGPPTTLALASQGVLSFSFAYKLLSLWFLLPPLSFSAWFFVFAGEDEGFCADMFMFGFLWHWLSASFACDACGSPFPFFSLDMRSLFILSILLPLAWFEMWRPG